MSKVIPANIPRHREVEGKTRQLELEEALRKAKAQKALGVPISFKVEPVYLSPEHARHYERFTGYPYDAEEIARIRAWVAFKIWNHRLQQVADQARPAKPVRPRR